MTRGSVSLRTFSAEANSFRHWVRGGRYTCGLPLSPFAALGGKCKIRLELAWFRSFRKHRSFSPDVFAVKKRAAVVLHFMRRANANGEHSTMWAWYWLCKNFYHISSPEQRRWALFCHLCLRQRRYKVPPIGLLLAL